MATSRPRPLPPTGINHVSAYDFVFDTCADGRSLKCLTVVDEFTRECLAIDVAGRIRYRRSQFRRAFANQTLPFSCPLGATKGSKRRQRVADRTNDAFDVGILPGGARCRPDSRETEGLDRPVECGVEGGITVVEEKPSVRVIREGLAELLSGPYGGGVLRHIDMQNAPSIVGEDDEDE